MSRIIITALLLALLGQLTACGGLRRTEDAGSTDAGSGGNQENTMTQKLQRAGIIPEQLREIPAEYREPCDRPGTLEKLTYDTWESFSYAQHSRKLTKEAWVYLPWGYDPEEVHDIFYLSHGGWSNETTIMGTDREPSTFKNVVDHAMARGEIAPMILVMPTYNNTSPSDSGDYSLAIRLTDQFHNELVNDLMPAVESTYHTYARDTTPEGLMASRDHRGFGGFSMGSVNTWCTFRYALDYFRYFMPMSGNYGVSGSDMAAMVSRQGRAPEDFFIYAMSGPDDFAYSSFRAQIRSMSRVTDTFAEADTEAEGNLAFREMSGYPHGPEASDLYTYNGLQFFWAAEEPSGEGEETGPFDRNTSVRDVMEDPVLGPEGRLLFPADTGYMHGSTLGDLQLTWYSSIDPEETVEIVNDLYRRKKAGETVFYDLYSPEEKKSDPDKEDTGLFFFRGKPGAKFAVCNAGGGFAYVGAMQDSFPHALELSRQGYNAFALIYRPGARTACEDLARAIAFIFRHAEELEVDTDCYSLWGGSAGARMAAWLGSFGTGAFGEKDYPRAGAVIMQYTGLSEVYGNEPPTYNCVGTRDGIAYYGTMEQRIRGIRSSGTDAEIEVFDGLSHGFGLGTGTVAEGWFRRAVAFWERQM